MMKRILYTLCISGILLFTSAAVAAEGGTVVPQGDKAAPAAAVPADMFSAYVKLTSAAEETLLTVPADRHFVLTDIVGMASIEIKQGNKTKLKVQLGYSPDKNSGIYQSSVNLKTGIVFDPGTEVVVYPFLVGMGKQAVYGHITLSGYYF